MSLDPVAFIEANLPVVPVPAIPEIMLHTAGPSSGLGRFAEGRDDFGAPYWAYYWAGGLALARFVLDHPELVAGRRVLDLGAGSGLVAIAAAKAGASVVIAAEIDRCAIVALGLNVAINGADVSVTHDDLTGGMPPPVDVILVGDLFYDRRLAEHVTAFLDRCLVAGIEIFVGDPRRAYLPVSRLALMEEYEVAETGSITTKQSGVFAFHA